jgi:hypothetical protein
MFEAWETFYLMLGTSGAALVGVMFIVTTLAAEINTDEINRGTVIYQTPIVFHLGVIVAASALAIMPDHLASLIALLLVVMGIVGLAYSVRTTLRMFERYEFYSATTSDKFFFGVGPALLYLVMGAGGATVWLAPGIAAEIVGAAMLALLLVCIRNAWDVATFSVRIARGLTNKQHPPE